MTGKGDTAKAQGCADERGLGGASSGVRCAGQRQLGPKPKPWHRRSPAVLVCSLSDRNPEDRARYRIGLVRPGSLSDRIFAFHMHCRLLDLGPGRFEPLPRPPGPPRGPHPKLMDKSGRL